MSQEEEALVQCLIDCGEAVEYGERWTPETTHEWWRDENGDRHVRLVMTYHGGGSRGDDDEAEYLRRLLDMGRAVETHFRSEQFDDSVKGSAREQIPSPSVTHVITADGKAVRIRYYVAPPEGVSNNGPSE